MAEKTKRNRSVDDAGIRLAPAPLHGERSVTMPSVRQEFVIAPELRLDAPTDEAPQTATVSTEHDFQPKKKDVSKKWKRRRRSKNIAFGVVMLLLSGVILLQYILGAIGGVAEKVNTLHIVLVPDELGALNNIVEAFKLSMDAGWRSAACKEAWISCLPSLILSVGLIAVFVNLIKSLAGLFGAVKPRRYLPAALVYLLSAFAVLIIYLVGAPSLGVERIDFVADVIKGYQSSELFGILVFALGYLVVSVVCSWISSEKYGYLK